MWVCSRFPACDAYVRCHEGSTEAMGRLAGKRLRKLRGLAHEALDPLWRDGGRIVDRDMFYRIAGEVMGIRDLHIGNLDEEGCLRLISRAPLIEAALNRHAALVLHPDSVAALDADTRDLLRVLFDVSDAASAGKHLLMSRLMACSMPVQDLHVRGVLHIDRLSGPDPIVSLSDLGRQLLAMPSATAQRQS